MRRNGITAAAVAALGAALVLTGCSTTGPVLEPSGSHEPGSAYRLQPLPEGALESHMSFAITFGSLDDVMKRSTGVVVGHPVSERVEMVVDLPSTVVTFKVDEVMSGDIGTDEVNVRYTGPLTGGGEQGTITPSLPTIPKEGLEYVLALEPYILNGKDTGDYTVSGPGQWVREYSDQRFTLDLHEHDMLRSGHSIPLNINIVDLETELQRIGR